MRLTFVRTVTNNGGSPTLWATDRADIEIPAELVNPEDRNGDTQP